MSAFAAHRLQEAVYAALLADADLSARITALYDSPPEGAVAPYIAFGDTSIESYDTKSTPGNRIRFDVVIWSQTAGQMEAKEIMALVDAVLHKSLPPVAGFQLVSIRLEGAQVTRDRSDAAALTEGRLTYRAVLFASL